MTDDEKAKLPKWLREELPLVHAKRPHEQQLKFRARREKVVLALRARGLSDTQIAGELGVTQQYIQKAFPRAKPPEESKP